MDRYRTWLGGSLILALALAYHLIGLADVPPGLDRDAAANGWMALKWLRYGIVPFWMPHASAPEPLIVWLQTATTALMGPSVAALRSASALFLSLAALAAYLLTLEVARVFPPVQRWWAALFVGIVFACNPVVTQLARTGLRATTLPLLSALFFLLLLRAWRTNARRDYIISGLLLGLCAYTYLAARFLPVVALVFVALALWISHRQSERSEESPSARRAPADQGSAIPFSGLFLMGISVLVVVLPQLFFFAVYPAAFWERAQSVSLLANPIYQDVGLARLLVDKITGMALMLGIEWSGQYNQAARPLLLPLPFAGLVFSLPVIVRWHRQPAILLMVSSWLIMLLPDLIGGDRLQPHELRVIGAFVPIMVLSGMGLAYALGWLVEIAGRKVWNVAGTLLALLIAGWGIVDWFGAAAPALARSEYDWFARPDVAIAQAINANDAPMLVPLNDYSRSIVAYLTAARISELGSGIHANGQVVFPSSERVLLLWPADPARTRVESSSYRFDPGSLVLIDGGRTYLMPPARAGVAQLQSQCTTYPFTTATGQTAGELCELDFAAFDFPAEMPAPRWAVGDLYQDTLRLHGISADSDLLSPGADLGITSFWQAERPTSDRWRYFVHVLDDQQAVVAGDDLIPGYGVYETQLWQPGEIVAVRQVVQLPETLAPGRYWIEVGLYDPLNGQRALVSDSQANRTLVGPLKVPLAGSAELPDMTPRPAQFGDEIALDGYTLKREGDEFVVSLRLAALRQPEKDYTLFVHVEDASGGIVAQHDAQPLDGQYPTSLWDEDEVVVSAWRVSLPATLEAGTYRVWIGLYEWQSGARLPIQSGDALADADRLLLEELTIR